MTKTERLKRIAECADFTDALDGARKFLFEIAEYVHPMVCGHPGTCSRDSKDGTTYCQWCKDVEQAKGKR